MLMSLTYFPTIFCTYEYCILLNSIAQNFIKLIISKALKPRKGGARHHNIKHNEQIYNIIVILNICAGYKNKQSIYMQVKLQAHKLT